VFGDILFEGLAGDALDDVAGEGCGVIGISGNDEGGKDALWHVILKVLIEGKEMLCVGDEKVAGGFFVTGSVSEDIAKSDWLAESGRNREVEILGDVLVEIELSLLDELHDGGPGEEF